MKFLIADDHPIFRVGLRDLLADKYPDVSIIECSDGTEALDKIINEAPDVSVLDIDMPGKSGLEIIKTIVENKYNTKAIILTVCHEKEIIDVALKNGALGFVAKDYTSQSIIECINTVLKNEKYIMPFLNRKNFFFNALDKNKQDKIYFLKERLTQTEIKIIKLICKNHSSREIGGFLFLSEKTIENYRYNICKKLLLPVKNNSLLIWVNENKEIILLLPDF